jgi:hypothetical protein
MHCKLYLTRIVLAASTLIIWGMGCAEPPMKQPPATSYMQRTVGTPDELSPQAPGEATNVRKVGNHWTCVLHGQTMVYNAATAQWEPQK